MRPLAYHQGQLAVQAEANTSHVAAKLAAWVGPAEEYAADADLVLLAASDGAELRVVAISGAPPLVLPVAPGILELPARLWDAPWLLPADGGRVRTVGGLVMSLERAERARLNGSIVAGDGRPRLVADEEFTLCRKYLAPSVADATELRVGPSSRLEVALDDPRVAAIVSTAETAFLASVSPDGSPDVAHRGGPPGFLRLQPGRGIVSWTEYVGDGVFKSAGNVRATGAATLVVLDLATGDAVEVVGSGRYVNTLERFRPRLDALVRMPEPFPEQGRLEIDVTSVRLLTGFIHPRRRLDARRVTSRDHVDVQAPR
ncbi:MAG: pyridoxamine 5'-phosphate oxidase family protein [Chloroflexi bacterium]|jgi:hypothetical protein|nr:pyridoxamine 5'-phosphate oxidase family protein [Chloroflexota bacterium]